MGGVLARLEDIMASTKRVDDGSDGCGSLRYPVKPRRVAV